MIQRSTAVWAILFAFVACTERESVGEAPSLASYSLSPEPVTAIGGSDQRPGHQLHYADAALRLSNGRIAVADVASSEVRFFDADGELVSVVGGQGEGPGEFQRLRSVTRMAGDSIAAWDARLRRMTLISPEGVLASTFTVSALPAVIEKFQERVPNGAVFSGDVYGLNDGRVMIEPLIEPMSWPAEGVVQDSVRFALLDRTAEHWTELGPFPGWERFAHGGTLGPLPFGRRLSFATGDSLLYVGFTGDAEVQVISGTTGDVVGSIILPMEQRPVASADIEIYRDRRVAGFMGPSESVLATMAAVPWPTTFPFFTSLRIGADGRLWVQRFQAPTDTEQEWLVFESSGQLAFDVRMDAESEVMDVGQDYVLVRVRNDLDEEQIRMHSLVARP